MLLNLLPCALYGSLRFCVAFAGRACSVSRAARSAAAHAEFLYEVNDVQGCRLRTGAGATPGRLDLDMLHQVIHERMMCTFNIMFVSSPVMGLKLRKI